LAHQLYSQALQVAKDLKADKELENLEKVIQKIELDMLLQRLTIVEDKLTKLNGIN